MGPRPGQSAIEFLILAGVMLLALLGLALVLGQRSAILHEQARVAGLVQAGEVLSLEVRNAARVEDGYERTFELPATAGDEQYTVTLLAGTELSLRTRSEEYVIFLPANVSLDGAQYGTLGPGRHTLRKQGGQIILT